MDLSGLSLFLRQFGIVEEEEEIVGSGLSNRAFSAQAIC